MKIIFLDIDGVLNSSQWYDSLDGPAITMDSDIDDNALSLLINYIKKNDLSVVITSSWRESTLKDTVRCFNKCKLRRLTKYIIGVTPRTYERIRGKEIDIWMSRCGGDIDEFVIIDDDDFDIHQKKHLVHTNWETGLTENDLKECDKKLHINKH